MASSSGDGVWPTRGAEASGLKCGRKRAADRGEDGKRLGCRSGEGRQHARGRVKMSADVQLTETASREWTLMTSVLSAGVPKENTA